MSDEPILVEPKRWVRQVVCRTIPLWLYNAMHRVAFGWWLEKVDWERQADGRFLVNLTWQRRPAWYTDHEGHSVRWYYGATWGTTLRLAWLWLWSKPVQFERRDLP